MVSLTRSADWAVPESSRGWSERWSGWEDVRFFHHGGGSYISYLERKFLTGFAAPCRPGLPRPRHP